MNNTIKIGDRVCVGYTDGHNMWCEVVNVPSQTGGMWILLINGKLIYQNQMSSALNFIWKYLDNK